jgi:sulfur carrier protein
MDILKINGVEKEFPAGRLPATLAQILEHLGVEAATVVAEIDGQIIEREKFHQTKVQKGQSIELVRFVPGG